MFDLAQLAAKIGGMPDCIARLLKMRVELVTSTEVAAHAVVRDGAQILPVLVRRSLMGRCPCARGAREAFCDHIAAAALTWFTAVSSRPEASTGG